MGKSKRAKKAEQFSFSIGDPAFAAWLTGTPTDEQSEIVTPYTVLGLSAVLRSVQVISTTIGALPLRTYERQGEERVRVPSVFDDPWPGIDGLTPFAWSETVLIHLLLWREAFLWHEPRADGLDGFAYRPVNPDAFEQVKRSSDGRRVFTYTDPDTNEKREVGSETVTYIPGPSLDGTKGHPLLWAARHIFSGALAGDKAASKTLRLGIRLAGLITPADSEENIDPKEGEEIVKQLRPSLLGSQNAGDIAFINRNLKLEPWTPNNSESQWHEARLMAIDEAGRLFGVPPHLLNAIEKQTSWGTGVAEQNLGLARFTLMGWSSRIEQILSIRLDGRRMEDGEQFCEYDYKGLLQGTPQQEIELLIHQVDAGILTIDEARKILNLAPLTPAQKAEAEARIAPPTPLPVRQEATA